jgi:hypothetical protein
MILGRASALAEGHVLNAALDAEWTEACNRRAREAP